MPLTSPNPMRGRPAPAHRACIVTSSPSSRNERVVPSGNTSGFSPRQVNSIMLPRDSNSLPEIVPEPKRSPARTRAPLLVACASCCAMLQYIERKFVRVTVRGARPSRRIRSDASVTSSAMS
jgi:hypothetical protein